MVVVTPEPPMKTAAELLINTPSAVRNAAHGANQCRCNADTHLTGLQTDKSQQDRVPAMWGSVLGLALLTALNPLRLGLALLIISRPRPVQNLLAYWVGCLTGCIPAVVVPLTLLHVTPIFKTFAGGLAMSSTVRHIQLGMGVLALSIAALMTARALTRRRQRAQLATPGGNTSTLVLDSNTPTAISRLLSLILRLPRRVQNAWENGSSWVAFVIGMGFGGTEPDVGLVLLTIIVTSGAAIGTQISAAIAFIAGTLAIIEITLVSYLAAPTKTQGVLRQLHDWALAHRRQILVAIFAVVGVSLVAHGMGTI